MASEIRCQTGEVIEFADKGKFHLGVVVSVDEKTGKVKLIHATGREMTLPPKQVLHVLKKKVSVHLPSSQIQNEMGSLEMRAGNMAPGWVGIRMNVNGTAMGGETDFTGNRLQFSVGDIYNKDVTDAYNTDPAYVEGHTYRVQLYDESNMLMDVCIDPTQMNYFAIDCDETAKFYRVVVWDETAQTRVGVGNPIWNTTIVAE